MKNKKSLGQNWLRNRAILEEIAECAGGGEVVLEVGPGLGTLTASLLRRFDKVVAVEFDERLANNLPASFPGKNLEVLHENILDFDLSRMPRGYAVAGNVPYYITSPIIRKFLGASNRPVRAVFLVQKEVAERLAASAGQYSVLGLSAQLYARVSLGVVVSRYEFEPVPKVDSQVVILEPYDKPVVDDPEGLLKLIKRGFSSPRKKLYHNLALGRVVLGDYASMRAQELSIEDWVRVREMMRG